MADSSFDVVSKIDRQEVANALKQASKELSQRYDFRGTNTTVEFSGEDKVVLTSDAEERVKAGLEVFQEKLIKRGLSLKAFDEALTLAPPQDTRQTALAHYGRALALAQLKQAGPAREALAQHGVRVTMAPLASLASGVE